MKNQKSRLLLVDDDSLVLATFGTGLKQAGYDVVLADNSKEGFRHAVATPPPDLAILDIYMPKVSGIEMAQGLKELGIPSMFFSAYGDDENVQKAIQDGALGYLVKPIKIENAIPAIETALKRAQDIKELTSKEQRLGNALETSRIVDVVIGILMERHKLGREDAFDILRKRSQSERRKVKDVARDVLTAWEAVNNLQRNS
ncbi:MAG: response regulator [Candidatus Thiodiazotropha sp.]